MKTTTQGNRLKRQESTVVLTIYVLTPTRRAHSLPTEEKGKLSVGRGLPKCQGVRELPLRLASNLSSCTDS